MEKTNLNRASFTDVASAELSKVDGGQRGDIITLGAGIGGGIGFLFGGGLGGAIGGAIGAGIAALWDAIF
jgi:hypothetical protein